MMKQTTLWMLLMLSGARCLTAAESGETGPAVVKTLNQGIEYLDNGAIRVGADLAQGGAITYLADANERVNVVNDHDSGRQIQMSLFMGPVPYLPEGEEVHEVWHVLGYNPVQVGDAFGNRSSVVDYRNDGELLYVKCIPLLFPLDNVPAECVFESWIRLEGRTVRVRNRLTNSRSDTTQYPPRFQELPALYTTAPLHRLMSYTGDKPYTGDALTRFTKVWDGVLTEGTSPWSEFESTENWAALLDDDDWGLGVWNPGVTHFLGGYFDAGNGKHIPDDNSAGYIAPGRVETLDHNIQYEYNYVLVLGTLEEIRSYVYEHADKSRSTLPDHGFEHDREHWHYGNARDAGWPIHGELHVLLEQTDPQIIGPSGFWHAKDAPRLFIKAACKTSDTRAQVYWKCVGDTSFSEEKSLGFQVNPDGEYHTYELDLSVSPHYRGAIAGLRFDPVRDGAPGDYITISFISFRDREKCSGAGLEK